ncbi:metal-dependent hydrolase [Agromyces aurantiacus]|uniref:Metal-dependent hydrolase n=1 Tax=Agromyces aurantiacus TaxID=165814 RepID=A0ABV9R163_9MICO|nr:metal-dependent hydrolase [Agromyces aurantiacus]MBM7505477.1 alanyl-tRNA synthetase [Agromyces aurantiacus]
MALPAIDTVVTFPVGELIASATVVHVAPFGEGLAVIADRTSIHPVDRAWPDQPADPGVLRVDGREVAIRDALVAATDGTELHIGDIPVRPGTDGWTFVVAHVVDGDAEVAEGDEIELEADGEARRALSIGHTACHAAALALNRALAGRWSKAAREDALGSPDFDGIAIATSRIHAMGSVDRYRLNKSLRRAGFDATGLGDELDALAASVDATLAEWVAADARVRVERVGEHLSDRRTWVCELPEGSARIPCGGTHAGSLGELGAVHVAFELGDDAGTPVLTMTTTAQPGAA